MLQGRPGLRQLLPADMGELTGEAQGREGGEEGRRRVALIIFDMLS